MVSDSFYSLHAYCPWHGDPIHSSSAKFTHCIINAENKEKHSIIKINIIQQILKYNKLI